MFEGKTTANEFQVHSRICVLAEGLHQVSAKWQKKTGDNRIKRLPSTQKNNLIDKITRADSPSSISTKDVGWFPEANGRKFHLWSN